MSNYKVYVTVEGVEDTTMLEARSPVEAAFISGVAVGSAIVADESEIYGPLASLRGVGEVQYTVETVLREGLDSVLVEEL